MIIYLVQCELARETSVYTYLTLNGILYRNSVLHSGEDEGYLQHGILQPDGSIDYVVQFYNGGTYEGEMLEELVQKLNK